MITKSLSLVACVLCFGSMALAAMPASVSQPDPALYRQIDPENLMIVETTAGAFAVEMAPRFAPGHVARFKELAREKFYDGIVFHRVIDRFMAQTGDPTATGTGSSSKPDMKAEFTFRRGADMSLTAYATETVRVGTNAVTVNTGLVDGFPIASQPDALRGLSKDGKVDSWVLHCKGVVSTARESANIHSGNSQIFFMRADAPSLDAQYTAWGRIVDGQEAVNNIAIGTVGQTPGFKPDKIVRVRIAADIPTPERPVYWVERTDTPAFVAKLDETKRALASMANLCAMPVATIRTH